MLPLTGLSDLTGDSAMLTKLKPSGRGDSFLLREGEVRPSGDASGDAASCMNVKVVSTEGYRGYSHTTLGRSQLTMEVMLQ